MKKITRVTSEGNVVTTTYDDGTVETQNFNSKEQAVVYQNSLSGQASAPRVPEEKVVRDKNSITVRFDTKEQADAYSRSLGAPVIPKLASVENNGLYVTAHYVSKDDADAAQKALVGKLPTSKVMSVSRVGNTVTTAYAEGNSVQHFDTPEAADAYVKTLPMQPAKAKDDAAKVAADGTDKAAAAKQAKADKVAKEKAYVEEKKAAKKAKK